MLPHFLCIGAQEAGTTWLYQRLNEHPDVWMPPIKELHYFDHLFVPENRAWTKRRILRSVEQAVRWHVQKEKKINTYYIEYIVSMIGNYIFTEDWYRRTFERKAAIYKIIWDITPEYCMISDRGVEYVRKLLDVVKIIYIIREPVDRALSQIRTNFVRWGVSIPSADEREHFLKEPDIFTRGAYSSYILRWRRAFAERDILFLPFHQLASDPVGFLAAVEKFLGVEPKAWNLKAEPETAPTSGPMKPPPRILDRLERRPQYQREFLVSEFGQDFVG